MTTPTTTAATHAVFTQHWAILATEAAVVLLFFALGIGLLSWLGRRKRINAARALLDERNDLAETATETFHTHVQALATGKTLTPDELDDYEQRSLQVVNELVEPWLEPSAENLRDAVRQIMTIRHNDLHQIAAIFRQQQAAEPISDNSANAPQIQQLQTELAASQKTEAERSAQLAEALKSVSIIVGEYGRKFGVEADYRVPQILRALIYLQSIDKGMNQKEASDAADASMDSGIDVFDEENLADESVKATPTTPATDPVSASSSEPKAVHKPESKPAPKAPENEPQVADATASTAQTEIGKQTASTKETVTAPDKQPEEPKIVDLAETSSEPKSDEIKSVEKVGTEEHETTEEQIDLDAVELPENAPDNTEFNLDLDDIDALLDAEISRQQEKATTPTTLPNLDDDELDLSKKP
ncbi:hypothetical protein [Halothiobacillus neapolitanus]|uniref:Uncharacterized protein n=1 Tax=Halothiobacillus neapolitanus (strain ATCC 23641 / DSM 15147 / CIP 104769 / NCIMB 8539 / c2) TaxID=555778 RepID=D0KZM1_HALNC|nr:hypothetical protein [Halothiobacillus neapolitanus]ACX95894.1 hypothetical protein Hneap_1058 [Halothiobacillus neapolitanus c2]TDN66205.1 hypothetical protein C8D83_101531 [Halothiobacillus neapolitanus]